MRKDRRVSLRYDEKFVVIELKAGTTRGSALTQILAYMVDIAEELTIREQVRGMLVAYDFVKKLVAAASLLPNLQLLKYQATFQFEEV